MKYVCEVHVTVGHSWNGYAYKNVHGHAADYNFSSNGKDGLGCTSFNRGYIIITIAVVVVVISWKNDFLVEELLYVAYCCCQTGCDYEVYVMIFFIRKLLRPLCSFYIVQYY